MFKFEDAQVDLMAKKPIWFGISLVMLIPGIIAMIMLMSQVGTPVKLGIDFTGGSLIQASFPKEVRTEEVRHAVEGLGFRDVQVQIASNSGGKPGKTALIRTKAITNEERPKVLKSLKDKLGDYKLERFESVGPTVGKELLSNALMALFIAMGGIIVYVSMRYQFDFAICAIAALLHDVLFVLGVFAILGLGWNVEVDSLFVTALLTVVGFSVHDTIVIFDRIRENLRAATKRDTFDTVANRSILQTFARSINTSLTVCLTLLALLIFGGETIRWFVFAMLIGIVSGGYSSIFNASQLLSVWRNVIARRA